jgi:hypothetical protein
LWVNISTQSDTGAFVSAEECLLRVLVVAPASLFTIRYLKCFKVKKIERASIFNVKKMTSNVAVCFEEDQRL